MSLNEDRLKNSSRPGFHTGFSRFSPAARRQESEDYLPVFLRIILTILGAAYIISPYDAFPDLIPGLGQVDDLSILALLFFVLWKKRLPSWLWRPKSAPREEEQKNEESKGRPQADPVDPYEVLGLQPGATPDEIRSAYRLASQRYHPDKVAHLGDEFQELAHRKFQEIQKAYETLRGGRR